MVCGYLADERLIKKENILLKFTLAASMAFLISGCSDPKIPNEKNFAVAVQAYLDTTYPKCYLITQFPTTVEWDVGGMKTKLRALAKAGLVLEKEGSYEIPTFGGRKRFAPAPAFTLTDEGKKFYKADAVKLINGKTMGGFCFGKARVKQVDQFTEPSDTFGMRISRVNYTYEVKDLPTWAQSPAIQAVIPELKADAESDKVPIKKLDVLVLTNNGWVHERLFKK